MVPHMVPRVTHRLQFHEGFRFADAARLSPYLARQGISHVYASPYMKSRPGSTHGYDIVDHRTLNPELGDQTDFDRMVAAFAENGLGHILDFVPNHIGVGGADNPCGSTCSNGVKNPNTQAGSTSIGSRTIPTYAPNCWFRFSASNTASSLRQEISFLNSTAPTAILRYGRTNDTSCRSPHCTTRAYSGTSMPSWSAWAIPLPAYWIGVLRASAGPPS